jgi:hypothetical protein
VPVLYLGADNTWPTMAQRIKNLCAGRRVVGPAAFLPTDPLNLSTAEGAADLRTLIRRTSAGLVVVESWRAPPAVSMRTRRLGVSFFILCLRGR